MFTQRFYRVYPELSLFPDDGERVAALRKCHRRLYRMPRFWAATLSWIVAQGAIGIAASHVHIPFVTGYVPRVLLAAGVPVVLLGLGFIYIWRRPFQRLLREELKSRGVRVCLHCGYDLRAQTEPRCPECGRPSGQDK